MGLDSGFRRNDEVRSVGMTGRVEGEEGKRWIPAFAGKRKGEGQGIRLDSGFRRNDDYRRRLEYECVAG